MAKKTLTKDRNSTWSVDDNGGTWKVAVNVLIKTQNAPGILEEEGSSNNRIIVNGDIRSVNARCIDLTGGVGTEVTVGQQSTLKGFIGVAAHGDNQVVNNRGTIIAESIAISSGFIESRVVNDGSLVAEAGILALQARRDRRRDRHYDCLRHKPEDRQQRRDQRDLDGDTYL